MPVQLGSDNKGCFAKWGNQGHKYYYQCGNTGARERAKDKALAQGVAIGEFLTIHERFEAVIKFLRNDNNGTK
jgi:hypothetical protein